MVELGWLGLSRSLQTSNLASLMKGCQGFALFQSGSPPTFPHIFYCVCVREVQRFRNSHYYSCKKGLAAEEREEKRGEDCVWNCPSVAVVVLSHFISATATLFLPSICPATILPLSRSRKTLALSPWMAQHNPPRHLSCSRYLYTQHCPLSKCYSLCVCVFLLSLNPIIFVELQSTEELPHFTSSAHAISICSLRIRVAL